MPSLHYIFDVEKKDSIKTLLLTLWKSEDDKVTKTESGELGSAVSAYIERIQSDRSIVPSFNTFYEYMRDDYRKELAQRDIKVEKSDFNIDNMLTTMRQYYRGGRYDFLLNSTENIDLLGKRVITATEMLESMIHNPRPTRAEISDVANAVYDGTSAVMLSGESAAGKYPVKTVQTMAEIVEETEKHIDYETLFRKEEFQIKNMVDAISHATCCMACDIGAKTIVVSSLSGATVRMVSRFRVPVDIVGMATNERVWSRLALSWGVQPILCEETFTSTDVLFYNALHAAKKAMHLHKGDNIVMTAGNTNGASGNTNLIKVETI